MKNLNISVVIPLYNKAPYIKRAIDSILKQSVHVDEIIVVDDGSTDGGWAIVEHLQNPLITLIRQKNMGPTTARNVGIEKAKYELIAFLDADDEWLPGYLQEIYCLVSNFSDCGAYATSSLTVRPDCKVYYPDLSFVPPEPWIGIIPNIFTLLQHGLAFNSSSLVIQKSIIGTIGWFPAWYYTGDIEFWIRIGVRYPIAFSPKRKVVYHQEATNRTASTHNHLEIPPVVDSISQMIENNTIATGELRVEAQEYIAKKVLTVAIQNILVGEKQKGIELLMKCNYTRKYKKTWLTWRVWSLLPQGLPKILLSIKEKVRGY